MVDATKQRDFYGWWLLFFLWMVYSIPVGFMVYGAPVLYPFMIAEMAYEVESMRLMTLKAASVLESGKDARREAYLAKIYTGDMAMKITDYGVQILGGHGYVREYPVERYYRNGRGIAILEGLAIV